MSSIGIIGIGLIGSSLCRAFGEVGLGPVNIYDSNSENMKAARELGLGDTSFESAAAVAAASDVVFVCVPVASIVGVAREAASGARPGTVITDVGSVKEAIGAAMSNGLPEGVAFVPGHPIAGTEHSGPKAGRVDLFKDKTYVLTPGRQTPEWAVQRVAELVTAIGARVCYLKSDVHDQIFAYTSHLPHICAFAAMTCPPAIEERTGAPIAPFAGSSLRDLTRVAGSDPMMWRDIFFANRRNLGMALELLRCELDQLGALVKSDNEEDLLAYLERAREARLKLFAS
jgi:cyclohexadieny/prephenate dehydrogenase